MKFAGFPRNVRYTPVPDPLFGPLLEEIEDLAELKVTLRAFWLWHQKRGFPRFLPESEFLTDSALVRGVRCLGNDPQEAITEGLRLAVARGSLLEYRPEPGALEGKVYLINTETESNALARIRREASSSSAHGAVHNESPVELPSDRRPNIFALYEDNIGTLAPILVEHLKEAEQLYSEDWIAEAFNIAVTQNKRSWSYISAILRRWAAEGKGHGEPGRHSQKDNRAKYIEEYQRRRGHLPWERAGG